MTRENIEKKIIEILTDFEIEDPDIDANLIEQYDFDSIDAVDMIDKIEKFVNYKLTPEEERKTFLLFLNKATISQICDFVEDLIKTKNLTV